MQNLLKKLERDNLEVFPYLENNASSVTLLFKRVIKDTIFLTSMVCQKTHSINHIIHLLGCSETSENLKRAKTIVDHPLIVIANCLRKSPHNLPIPLGPTHKIKAWFEEDNHQEALQQIVSLDASGCGLKVIPDEICKLENLETLNVSTNDLTYLPDFIFHMIKLRDLNLSNNQISVWDLHRVYLHLSINSIHHRIHQTVFTLFQLFRMF
jgi:Leucine-rich repeat (LRR) protein